MFNTQRLISAFSLILCGCSLALAGCGNQHEVSFKSDGMTQTFADGKEAAPKDFPIPLYPGATPSGSVSATGVDQSNYLILTTNDSVDQVADFYRGKLPQAGWQTDNAQAPAAAAKMISITAHRDKLEAQVMAAEEGTGKTTISISIGESGEIAPSENENTDNNEDFKPDKVTPPTD